MAWLEANEMVVFLWTYSSCICISALFKTLASRYIWRDSRTSCVIQWNNFAAKRRGVLPRVTRFSKGASAKFGLRQIDGGIPYTCPFRKLRNPAKFTAMWTTKRGERGPVGRGDERRRVKRKRGYIIRAVFAQGVFPYSASRALFHSSSSSRFDVKILGSYFNLPLRSRSVRRSGSNLNRRKVFTLRARTRVCIIRFAIFFANDSARSIPRTRIRRFCLLYREDFTYCSSVCALLYKYFPIGALRARWCRLYPE